MRKDLTQSFSEKFRAARLGGVQNGGFDAFAERLAYLNYKGNK